MGARLNCEPSICAEASCSQDLVTLKVNVDGRMVMGMTADGEAGVCIGVVRVVHAVHASLTLTSDGRSIEESGEEVKHDGDGYGHGWGSGGA